MNHEYEAAHKLGKLLFEGMFIDQFNGKEYSYMTLLIDMNELFEKFIVKLLQKHLPQHYEVAHGKRITDAIMSENKSYRHIIPDIVVKDKRSGTAHVIDTKYKFYDSKRIATPDIYQLSFYAQYFQESGPYHSSIIHPVFDRYTERTFVVETNPARLPGEIVVRGVKIEDLLKLIEGKLHLQLDEKALELL